jgi:hypothetical protein
MLICLGALFAVLIFTSGIAQVSNRASDLVLGMDVEFVGYDTMLRPEYTVGLWLAPHEISLGDGLIITLRDGVTPQPYNPRPPEATWYYHGRSTTYTRVTKTLVAPFYYRANIWVDMVDEQTGLRFMQFGPIMRPDYGATVTPYGPNTLDRNRLSLVVTRGLTPFAYPIDVWGGPPMTTGVVVLAAEQTRLELPWGTILIGPAGLVPLPAMQADEDGHLSTMLTVPPELVGYVIYAQAMVDSFEDSLTPWFFSQGVRLDIQP